MTTPTVTEIARALEPIARDTFVDAPRQAPPRPGSATRAQAGTAERR
jgi:hypothetical protein